MASPAPQQAGAGAGQPADLMTRFVAKLIDWVLLGFVAFIVVVPLIVGAIFTGASGIGGLTGFGWNGVDILGNIMGAALFIGYFAYLESSRGQTLGKMAMKIEVRGPDGLHPTMEQAIKRNAYMALSIIPFIGGLAQFALVIAIAVTINSDPYRQGLHDKFADGTVVVRSS